MVFVEIVKSFGMTRPSEKSYEVLRYKDNKTKKAKKRAISGCDIGILMSVQRTNCDDGQPGFYSLVLADVPSPTEKGVSGNSYVSILSHNLASSCLGTRSYSTQHKLFSNPAIEVHLAPISSFWLNLPPVCTPSGVHQ